MATAPPPLEETLVRGYVRLAAEAQHRRIDIELRILDIVLAALFGLLLLIPALLIALIQVVTSGRPILYRGEHEVERAELEIDEPVRRIRRQTCIAADERVLERWRRGGHASMVNRRG